MDQEQTPSHVDQHTPSLAQTLTVPVAIVIAGFVIAGSIIYSSSSSRQGVAQNPTPPEANTITMRAVSKDDHIFGDPNAPVKVVEYSDLECPFCKQFQKTMQQIMAKYGTSGKVAWVYRHFPLPQLHPKAPNEANAAECAGALGGNSVFWRYIDHIFEITPSNNGLDPTELGNTAVFVGLQKSSFDQCLQNSPYNDRVTRDAKDAVAAGGTGTPYSIVVAKNGKQFTINGAQPYDVVQATIDAALAEK